MIDSWQQQLVSFISCWCILCLLAIFLWYRNLPYDRIYSPIVFLLALTQLFVFGVYSGGNSNQAGNAIFLTVWLQPVIMAIAVYSYFYNRDSESSEGNTVYRKIAGWSIVISLVVFSVAVLSLFVCNYKYLVEATTEGDVWLCVTSSNTTSMFYYWGWLYVILMSFYILLLLAADGWRNWKLILTLILLWTVVLYFKFGGNIIASGYVFCFLVFTIWLLGAFK